MKWGKVVPVQAMKADTERTGTAPLILNLSRPWPLYPPGKEHSVPIVLYKRQHGPRAYRNISLPFRKSNPGTSSQRPVTIGTRLITQNLANTFTH